MRALMSAFDPKRTFKARHEPAPDSNLETGIALWGRPTVDGDVVLATDDASRS